MKNEASFLQLSKYTVHAHTEIKTGLQDTSYPTPAMIRVYTVLEPISLSSSLEQSDFRRGEAEGSAKSDMNLSRVCTLPDANV